MAQGFGHNAWAGVGEESVYGTGVAATDFLEIINESLKREHNYISKPALRSASQKNKVKSKKAVSGSVSFQAGWDTALGIFLKHGVGSVGTTGGGPTYTHTFTPAGSMPVGLSIVVNRDADNIGGSSAARYEGCQIQKLTLTQEIEDILMVEAEILGEDVALIAKPTPTFPTFEEIDWEDVTVMQLDVGGTPINLSVKRFQLVIENSLADDRYILGQLERNGLGRSAERKVTGELTIEYDGLDALNKFLNLTDEDVQFKWVNGTNSLQIDCPKVSFDGDEPTTDGPGPYEMTLRFTAYANAADNDEISIVLVNSTATIP